MNNQRFTKTVDDQIKNCKRILLAKGVEYAMDTEDRLGQFKRIASLIKTTPEQACIALMSKHIASLVDMTANPKEHSLSVWAEKLTDAQNYLLLLNALVLERFYEVEFPGKE